VIVAIVKSSIILSMTVLQFGSCGGSPPPCATGSGQWE